MSQDDRRQGRRQGLRQGHTQVHRRGDRRDPLQGTRGGHPSMLLGRSTTGSVFATLSLHKQ
jgi:hypothetical protein